MTWGIDCVIEYRGVLALSVSAVGGTLGLRPYPFPADHAALALVHLELPVLFAELTNMHAALWFSLSFVLPSIGSSWLYTNGRPQPPHSRHRTASTVSCTRTARGPFRVARGATLPHLTCASSSRRGSRFRNAVCTLVSSLSAPLGRARRPPACIPMSINSSRIAPATPRGRSPASCWKSRGLLPPGPRHLQTPWRRRRLCRGQSRFAVSLQPAP